MHKHRKYAELRLSAAPSLCQILFKTLARIERALGNKANQGDVESKVDNLYVRTLLQESVYQLFRAPHIILVQAFRSHPSF